MIHPLLTSKYEDEILDLIDNQDEFTRSDLQGIVTALVSRTGDRWKQIFDSLILTSYKLTNLGFTYYNGKVAIIENSEEDFNV